MGRETKAIFKCDHCDGVIGIYEPLIISIDGEPYQTSLAAEPDLIAEHRVHYHRSCYQPPGAAPAR